MKAAPTDLELAEKHKYRLPNGEIAIGVTTVLGQLDHGGKSSRMAGAAAKIAKEGGNYRAEWKAKADLGTRVHGHCERWLRGQDVEEAAEERPYLDALQAFFHEKRVQPVAIERVVLSEEGYGGRFDFIAHVDGISTLVDVKTGRKYGLEHACQLAAYRFADGMAAYDEKGKLVRVDRLPPIDRAGCLYLSPEGYEFVEYPADERALRIFKHLLDVYKGVHEFEKELPA